MIKWSSWIPHGRRSKCYFFFLASSRSKKAHSRLMFQVNLWWRPAPTWKSRIFCGGKCGNKKASRNDRNETMQRMCRMWVEVHFSGSHMQKSRLAVQWAYVITARRIRCCKFSIVSYDGRRTYRTNETLTIDCIRIVECVVVAHSPPLSSVRQHRNYCLALLIGSTATEMRAQRTHTDQRIEMKVTRKTRVWVSALVMCVCVCVLYIEFKL